MAEPVGPPFERPDSQRGRWDGRLMWLARGFWLLALFLALSIFALATALAGGFASVAPSLDDSGFVTAFVGAVALVGLSYATAGLLIVRQYIRHAVGWMLLVAGPAIVALMASLVIGVELDAKGNLLGAWLFLGAALWWWPVIMLAGPLIALVFPNGRLPSPAWRAPTLIVLGYALVTVLLQAARPFDGGPRNPLAIEGVPGVLYQLMDFAFSVGILAPLVLAVAALVTRFRRAPRDERQQMKWFVFAVLVWAFIFALSWLAPISGTAIMSFGSLLLIPAAIVVAITRYRLYEIDTLINRTLVYLSLIGIVAGLYAALIVLFQRLFVAVTGNTSDAAAIISALILAAVFHPIRKLVEGVVDRHFKAATGAPVTLPAVSARTPDGLDVVLNAPEFDAAVERIVRRVLSSSSERTIEGAGLRVPHTAERSGVD